METTRVKWDESMLVRCFARFNEARPKVSNPVIVEESEIPLEQIPEPKIKFKKAVESSNEWKDFANDIDWAMM